MKVIKFRKYSHSAYVDVKVRDMIIIRKAALFFLASLFMFSVSININAGATVAVESQATEIPPLINVPPRIVPDDERLSLQNGIINGVPNNTTTEEFITMFKIPGKTVFTVKNSTGSILNGLKLVGTGSVATITAGGRITDTAFVVVKGDINGDGVVDTTDYLTVKSEFLGIVKLEGLNFNAGDTDENGVIDTTDYMRIKGYFLLLNDL